MSWRAAAYVRPLRSSPDGIPITASEKLILLLIAEAYSDDEEASWPAMKRLSAEGLMSQRHLRRVLGSLEERGLIAREERTRKNGSQTTNAIRFPCLGADPGVRLENEGRTFSGPPSPGLSDVLPRGGLLTSSPEPYLKDQEGTTAQTQLFSIGDLSEFLESLGTVKNYPLDPSVDAALYSALVKEFGEPALWEGFRSWLTAKMDKPLPGRNGQEKKMPRLQIRTFVRNQAKWDRERADRPSGPAPAYQHRTVDSFLKEAKETRNG